MKRVGPELKMPDLKNVKVPSFLSDLYHDLADRRLLPLVALILVAIVAVPFLLGESEPESTPPPGVGSGGPANAAPASSLTVVEAQPGLRDYRRRLDHRSPTDPFRQRYTGAPSSGGLPEQSTSTSTSPSGGEGGAPPSSASPGGASTPVEPAPPAPETSPPSGDGGVPTGELRLFTFAADVRISSARTTADGKKEKSEPEVRRGVVPPTALPSPKAQVVTFMGISPKTRKPLFLISDDVEAIFGEGKCLSGSESCQLLEVDEQMPITFVHEPTGTRYKLNVLKVEPVLKGRFED
ncbi:MAG TPA: hypothetical protein VD741_07530 [Solirubrobacterales bacterium]|nr:hypothetical protein [Solirubrobacterales bacterium]